MKKLIVIAALVLAGCHTTKFHMGMSVDEFTSLNHNADLVRSEEDGTYIYRSNTHNNRVNKTMFYYFRNSRLVQVDEGQRRADFIIEHRN